MNLPICEGKTKIIYSTTRPNEVLIKFKDDITAFDGKKKDTLIGKGRINAEISSRLFEELERNGIPTHFIRLYEPDTILARKLDMIKLEVVCRNYAAGSFLSRFPFMKKGEKLEKPVIEFYLKDDKLGDPMLTKDHVIALGLVAEQEMKEIERLVQKTNEVLTSFMASRGMKLVDFKLEFGRDERGKIRIGDELSGDCMRIWDLKSGKVLDKDVYREGLPLDQVAEAYKELHQRIVKT